MKHNYFYKLRPSGSRDLTSRKASTVFFERQHSPDVSNFIWKIRILCREGQLQEALSVLKVLDRNSTQEHNIARVSILQCCAKVRAFTLGKLAHAIVNAAYTLDLFLGNVLLNMYVKCGSTGDAYHVFANMHTLNAVSWTTIIAGFVQENNARMALHLFHHMQEQGVKADEFTFVTVLNACPRMESLLHGKRIHADVLKSGYLSNVFLDSTLVDMYAKCGSIQDAYQVFQRMSARDIVSWNVMISVSARHGSLNQAFELLEQMQFEGIIPSAAAFVSLLNECAQLATLPLGKHVHAKFLSLGDEHEAAVSNTLLDMYSKCRSLDNAQELFDRTISRNVVSWSIMIAGYAQHEDGESALSIFEKMQQDGYEPDKITLVTVIGACAAAMNLMKGKRTHAELLKRHELGIVVDNAVINMYAKCSSMGDAYQIFDRMATRCIISWGAMITGYSTIECGKDALNLFCQMQLEGLKPDQGTFVGVLSSCATIIAPEEGKRIHAYVLEFGIESDVCIATCLIDMYGKCARIGDASEIFDRTHSSDVKLWNTIIGAYLRDEDDKAALDVYKRMREQYVEAQNATYMSVVSACSSIASLEQGKNIHAHMIKAGPVVNIFVNSAAVEMYAKCGSINNACSLFDHLSTQDVVSWSIIISGYAQYGESAKALRLFRHMTTQGVKPSHVTFVSVLYACSHACLMDDGFHYLSLLSQYEITPIMHHYACIVDLLGRVQSINYAIEMINAMPFDPNVVLWNSLLDSLGHGGYNIWNDISQLSSQGGKGEIKNLYSAACYGYSEAR